MFAKLFGSWTSSSSASPTNNLKRKREEEEEKHADGNNGGKRLKEQQDEEEEEEEKEQYDYMYMAILTKQQRDTFFKMSDTDLIRSRAQQSALFATKLTSVIALIKKHVPKDQESNLKIAEEKLRFARDTFSSSLSSFFFKYVSVPFYEDLSRRKFENIIVETNFMQRIDHLLKENSSGQEDYEELREKVRGIFGVLLGHVDNIRSDQSKNQESEEDWQNVCSILVSLFEISVIIHFIDELREEE